MQIPGVLHNPRVITGGTAATDAAIDLIGRANRTLTGEVFVLDDASVVGAINRQLDEHAVVNLLADTEHFARKGGKRMALDQLSTAGAKYVPHGDDATKIHSKSLVANGDDAIVTTAAFTDDTHFKDDISVLFKGDAARAVEVLTQAAFTQDRATIKQAAKVAAQHGIYVNDPHFGVRLLRKAVNGLIDDATQRIVLQTKQFSDLASAERLVAALADPNIDVRVIATTVSKKVQRVLDEAGINVERRPVHANVLISDDRAYVGSAYLQKRPMARSKAKRQSREMGVVLDGKRAMAALERTIGRGYVEPVKSTKAPKVRTSAG